MTLLQKEKKKQLYLDLGKKKANYLNKKKGYVYIFFWATKNLIFFANGAK